MTTASSTFAAAGGVGTLQMAAGSGPSAYLQGVSALNVDLISTLGYDKAPTGGGTFTSAVVRRIGTSDYRVKVRATASGTVLDLVRTVSGGETVLATQALTGCCSRPARHSSFGCRLRDRAPPRCGPSSGNPEHPSRLAGR